MVEWSRRRARRIAASATLAACAALSLGAAGAPAAVHHPAVHHPAATKWLCRPGLAHDPCTPGFDTAQVTPAGAVTGVVAPTLARPRVDCFYVYPTVSDQQPPEASLRVDPEERSIALYQAARYSSMCRVFAPMYRQITLQGLLHPGQVTTAMRNRAYGDVVGAFRTYLKKDNKGRGIVFIGHSQGAFVLRRLLAQEVDRKPAVRRRLISAVLLGGNVLVKDGSDRGGDFHNIPACRSTSQFGCVIAFSTFGGPPPENAIFGIPTGRSAVSEGGTTAGMAVLCTNPAALGGGPANLDSIFPTTPFAKGTTIGGLTMGVGMPVPQTTAAWFERRASYGGECSTGRIRALVITPLDGAPVLRPLPGATWGLHLVDANIALGDLVADVSAQSAAWLAR